ncbi:MAG: hypothetical protein JWM11_4428 [Planctomycetaceae bacterium]|nr:hypothetical protein [Planctomycetaceae bacterium]
MANDRRQFLAATTLFGVGAMTSASSQLHGAEKDAEDKKQGEDEISCSEDLMREHGVLNRILLIYEEGLQRLRGKSDITPDVFSAPATLVRKFVEDYHEKLEEKFIFPEFEKQKKLVDLVSILRKQHEAGRKATEVILRNSAPDQFRKEEARQEIVRSCEAFIRMYRPHEAREDTVLFPGLHKLVSAKRIAELGEQFEEQEHQLFGEEGFEKTVDQVAAIEKQLGIYDLALFTVK